MTNITEQFNHAAIPEFWRWFESKQQWVRDHFTDQTAISETLLSKLQQIHPNLVWEMDGSVDHMTGRVQRPITLTLSGDGLRQVFPAVAATVAAAPALPGWFVQAFRRSRPTFNRIAVDGQVVTMGDVRFVLEGARGTATLTLFANPSSSNGALRIACARFVDSLLGEFEAAMGLDQIIIEPAWHASAVWSQPLPALPTAFKGLQN